MEGKDTLVNHVGSRLQEEADIRLTYGVGKVKRIKRKYILLSGRIPNHVKFVVHNNTLVNVMRALIERVFYVEQTNGDVKTLVAAPTTTRAWFNGQMSEFSQKLRSELPYVKRMCLQEFVETSPKHKVGVYRHAMKTYLKEGLSPREAKVTAFVKADKDRVDIKSDPAPRIIQPRGTIFNLIFGCFIRPAEKVIYKAIDEVFGRPTVCCGQNAEQMAAMLRGAWDELTDPVAISLDLSRMDQHISVPALRWEHGFYRHIYANDTCYSTLDWCLQSTIKNEGRVYTTDSNGQPVKVKYEKTGSRMSGDMNTSLGNKIIMCGLIYSYYKAVCGFQPRVDFNVVDNGDDCVVVLSGEAYRRHQQDSGTSYSTVEHWFLSMGFTLKVEGTVRQFNHIEFCQTQPCFIDGRWIMVRGLKALAKDGVCLKPLNVLDKWISQVKGGGLATYGSVPIYSAYFESLPGREASDRDLLKGTGMYYLSKGMNSARTVTPQNRYEFWDTFGVTPREQEVIEQVYLNLKKGEVSPIELQPLVLPLPVI